MEHPIQTYHREKEVRKRMTFGIIFIAIGIILIINSVKKDD